MFQEVIKSLHAIPFQSASFFVEFDETTQEDKSYILELFKAFKNVRVSERRLTFFEDWKAESDQILYGSPIKSDLIFLLNYEDHIFIQPSATQFLAYAESLFNVQNLLKSPVIGSLSHFPEVVNRLQISKSLLLHRRTPYGSLVPCPNPIGAVLLSPKIFSSWWKLDFTGGQRIVALENPFGKSVLDSSMYTLVPSFEFLRHMDGYNHVKINHEVCPIILNTNSKRSLTDRDFSEILIFEGDVLRMYANRNNLNNSLLSEVFSFSQRERERTLIYKSAMLRLNPATLIWLRQTHSLSYFTILMRLFELFVNLPFFRILLCKSIAYLPIYLAIFVMSPITRLYARFFQNGKLLRFLLDGSSSGYFKILKWKIKSRIN